MLRTLAGVAAAGLLLWAGILVGSGATVTYAGTSVTCGGPIVEAETLGALSRPQGHVAAGLARECARTDQERLLWASLEALLGVGAVAFASGRLAHATDTRGPAVTPA